MDKGIERGGQGDGRNAGVVGGWTESWEGLDRVLEKLLCTGQWIGCWRWYRNGWIGALWKGVGVVRVGRQCWGWLNRVLGGCVGMMGEGG